MTLNVTFLPSGRTCAIEAHETVLEASLRAGLTPDYGCSNGNCGSCKARLTAGEIEQVRHHDFALTMAEKAAGGFLMCANRALSDIAVEANVTGSADDIPTQTIETRVKAIDELDPQVIRLHLQTPRSQRLRFIAGQSVTLTAGDGLRSVQAFASCPCDDRNLYFHIPLLPDDAFSEHVFSGDLSRRDTVRLTGPNRGEFYLDDRDERDSLILCWHTGFAPVISLMEHVMSLELEKDVHLYRFSPTPDRQYLSNLCRSWVDAYDNIHAELSPDRISLLSTVGECEAIFANITARHPGHAACNVYVAGPPNFVEAARNTFGDTGPDTGRIKTHTDWIGVID